MEIKYFGGDCFRIREKELYLLLGKPEKKIEADVILPGNGAVIDKNVVSKKYETPFIIPGPGEYEVSGVEIWGRGDNLWRIRLDDWEIGFMTNGWQMFTEKKVDFFGQIDVLFLILPEGKEGAKKAVEAVKRVSPLIVVPGMAIESQNKLGDNWVREFLDEMDQESLKAKDKLLLKKKDLPEEMNLILLKQRK